MMTNIISLSRILEFIFPATVTINSKLTTASTWYIVRQTHKAEVKCNFKDLKS